MVNNDDWDICFLLNTYFQLCNCELSTFFKFLEEIINPVVRAEYEQLKIIEDIVGFFIATAFAEEIAINVTDEINKFLFMDSFTANKIAIWLLLCVSVTMMIGKFRGTKIEKLCGWGSGLSLFILYVQYCRTVEQMDHYIIFSIIFFIVLAIAYAFFEGKKDRWQFGVFFSLEVLIMALWPFGFLVYAFFSKFIGFSDSFCLMVTSTLMCLISLFGMVGTLEES